MIWFPWEEVFTFNDSNKNYDYPNFIKYKDKTLLFNSNTNRYTI